jgi:hypothetical protein
MRLTWKDAIATVLTAGIVALYAAFLGGTTLPLVSSPRTLAAVFLIVGLTACAIGGTALTTDPKAQWAMYAGGTLGGVAFIAALITLVTGSGFVLAVLVGTTVALWLMATVRHTFTGPVRADDGLVSGHGR